MWTSPLFFRSLFCPTARRIRVREVSLSGVCVASVLHHRPVGTHHRRVCVCLTSSSMPPLPASSFSLPLFSSTLPHRDQRCADSRRRAMCTVNSPPKTRSRSARRQRHTEVFHAKDVWVRAFSGSDASWYRGLRCLAALLYFCCCSLVRVSRATHSSPPLFSPCPFCGAHGCDWLAVCVGVYSCAYSCPCVHPVPNRRSSSHPSSPAVACPSDVLPPPSLLSFPPTSSLLVRSVPVATLHPPSRAFVRSAVRWCSPVLVFSRCCGCAAVAACTRAHVAVSFPLARLSLSGPLTATDLLCRGRRLLSFRWSRGALGASPLRWLVLYYLRLLPRYSRTPCLRCCVRPPTHPVRRAL